MNIKNPVIKEGLSKIVNAARNETRQQLHDELLGDDLAAWREQGQRGS